MTTAPEPSHELTTNGVGPHPEPWPDDPRLDPELLAAGDSRNVLDRYRYWSMDAIVAELDTRRHTFDVAIENWQHDLNIGSIVRSANAFLAGTVHIIGRRRWNKRGAMVTDRYQHVRYHPDVEAFLAAMAEEQRPVVAIDNTPGAERIETATIPERCVFLFGQEGPGLTEQAVAGADAHLEIAQFGSTRSINASAAAAIVMHSWIVQHAELPGATS
ncbi:TrmH family RNA methyltransferase [Curtobacterium flaccumfaciens]|uniref:TrmH family RNA methyltransferase n=1 Tax=Curtobacterium flaccumfaciens TaxID=2035 RepID=UPI00188B7175|nr:TrmH family RNA methyltransferase [Curtobacterium flaccumfaciens]MBF4628071.1 rRNA methyltransferase [Curtobacterium flaccumfaciens]